MPTPRKKKVRKNLIGARVLANASLSTAPAADDADLLNVALYDAGKSGTAVFTNADTTLLTDAISDEDGNWSAGGDTYDTGETGDLSSDGSVKHYFIPVLGGSTTAVTAVEQPVIIYSSEGPRAKINHKYEESVNTSASITFDDQITGSGAYTDLKVYFAGQLHSESGGFDKVLLYTGSEETEVPLTGSISGSNAFQSGSIFIPTGSFSGNMRVAFSASNTSVSQWNSGFFVYITGSDSDPDNTGSAWQDV